MPNKAVGIMIVRFEFVLAVELLGCNKHTLNSCAAAPFNVSNAKTSPSSPILT